MRVRDWRTMIIGKKDRMTMIFTMPSYPLSVYKKYLAYSFTRYYHDT